MTSPATPAGARDPIDNLQERVTALHQQMSRATTTTAVVGVVAVILLTIYFNYAYNQIVDLTKPQSLVMHADQVLVDNLTTTREALQKQITESAPEWASELNRQAIASVPELRKGVESFIVAQLDEQLKEADLIGDDEFRKLLKEHKDEWHVNFRNMLLCKTILT